jgi:17beta-estradiol 17-dehydrogenase/3beta-hydroxysteroid 3-dehydrogenase/mitotic-spindle organizing protein 1
VCRETAALPKQYNVRRHFETKHPEVARLDAHEKKIKAANFVKRLNAEQQIFKKVNTENVPATKHTELGEKYATKIDDLIEEFDRRLTLSKEEDIQLKITEDPFSVDPADLPFQLELNIIDLQCSTDYTNKHRESSMQEFYRSLDSEKYKDLTEGAMKTFSIFGSTYICEQTFSAINMNKNKQRSCLTNDHLEDIYTTNMTPEYNKLVAGKRCNICH